MVRGYKLTDIVRRREMELYFWAVEKRLDDAIHVFFNKYGIGSDWYTTGLDSGGYNIPVDGQNNDRIS